MQEKCIMRTTITIPEKILNDVINRSGKRSKSSAVASALEDWVRMKKIQELRALRGTMDIKADLTAQRRLDKKFR